ncbi:MAG: endolytic transglycosylase MltG [Ruminococcaceae bacterium]|nr:endolytic transglycosylase MltG [Oscillospiraceae bacterium]
MAKKNKSKGVILCLIIVLLAVVGVFAGYIVGQAKNDIDGKRQPQTEYNLEITKNDFEYEIGQKLYHNKIVLSDALWTNWMSKHYPDFKYINGEYLLTADMSYEEIAEKLQSPDVSHEGVKVAIPEGYNVMEIAKTLEENGICNADDFLEVCKSTDGFDYDFLKTVPDSRLIAYKLEGFLFPATYDLAKNSEPKEVAEEMLDAFDARITDDMTAYCEKNHITIFELINLASVVQEEALGQKSAKNIASVFINRLNKGAKLQSDVTYYYARDLRDDYGFSQEVYDAYYTYRCPALPAGPITNPGMEIIEAVVNHPDTEYLYFFSDLQQEFHFAKDYDEFMALQKKYPWK